MITGFVSMGCLEDIDLQVPVEELDTVIVQGSLLKMNDHAIASVEVTSMFDYSPESRRTIAVKSVELLEAGGGKKILDRVNLDTHSTRIELGDPGFPIEYGNEYWVRVVTENNQVYVSTPDKLFKVPNGASLSFEYLPEVVRPYQEDDNISYFISGKILDNLDSRKSRLRISTRRTYRVTDNLSQLCYVDNPAGLNDIVTIDGNMIEGYTYDGLEVFYDNISSFYAEGSYLSLYLESLSDEAYQYWSEVSTLFQRTGNMFEKPVGRHHSNILNENDNSDDSVFGFFYATEIDTVRIYVDSSLVGTPTLACPPKSIACLPCCDCLGLTGSSLTKPEFWVN